MVITLRVTEAAAGTAAVILTIVDVIVCGDGDGNSDDGNEWQ